MTISIVIPVYNEASQLRACLDAIAAQTVRPLEVIVVDNNSTDTTSQVAARYAFVRLLREKKQGVVHARNCGFNAAQGDIIGRIDADTHLSPEWVANVLRLFHDPALAAVCGSVYYHDLFLGGKTSRALELFFRQWLANRLGDEVFLSGHNMALRRSAWLSIRPDVCNVGGIHEDYDLAIHLQQANLQVRFERRIIAGISIRRFTANYRAIWPYMQQSVRTYAVHGRWRQRYMYPVFMVVLASLWFFWLNHRLYLLKKGQLAWSNLFASENRVNPATFVDP